MLELQLPHPMPHAVAIDRHLDHLPPRSITKPDQHTLPPPRISSAMGSLRQPSTFAMAQGPPPLEIPVANGLHHQNMYQNGPKTLSELTDRVASINGRVSQPFHDTVPQVSFKKAMDSRSPTPQPTSLAGQESGGHRRKISNENIAPNLRVPTSIRTPQASIAQLAAEITCLFWFENSSTLKQVIEPDSGRTPVVPLAPDAHPTTGFRKWVATILSTTQVAQNVILLALLFIYRLKKINPTVKGKPGSEYRLLTVALMLGNKFLDDNTYTNKTWAEVSGISVHEVHIMEVEFLSNMRYSLYTSKADWAEWHVTLGKFGTFFDQASRVAHDAIARPMGPITPTLRVPPALPSPPTSHHTSPPLNTNYSPTHPSFSHTPLLLPQITSTAVSPIGPLPELDTRPTGRKRSFEDQQNLEPPAKRTARNGLQVLPTSTAVSGVPTITGPTLPRLPLPSLSIPQQPVQIPPVQLAPQLPPIPASRAMSLVYPPPVQWPQPQAMPPTSAAMIQPLIPNHSTPSMGDQSRQLSPYPGSAGSSPVSATFTSSQPSSQSRLSPSYFLSQRQSPYRPVRGVHTLLVPPPSASLHNPSRHISMEQMQYQPLGRPMTERRAGPVPYMHHEAWPKTNQYNQLPVLPQPNFLR